MNTVFAATKNRVSYRNLSTLLSKWRKMAEKRMFAKIIIDSDAFLDMPMSSQALYFHLSMRADDDGFVNNPRKIARMVGAADDDLRVLLTKNFLISFESGVIVIKHWRMHNTIQNDRYKKTPYTEELEQLNIKKNRSYTIKKGNGSRLDPERIQIGSNLDPQVRLDQVRSDKIRKDNTARAAWRSSFDAYVEIVLTATRAILADADWIADKEALYPELNVKMTIIKACKDFWMTEDGWKNKKSRRGEPNWQSTYRNALAQKWNWVSAGTHYFDGFANYAEL